MSRCLSLLALLGAWAIAVPVQALESTQLGADQPPTPVQAESTQASNPPPVGNQAAPYQAGPGAAAQPGVTEQGLATAAVGNAQFMAWSDGRCVTLRYAVKSASFPHFSQGLGGSSYLQVNYWTNPVGGPERIWVGEICFIDYGYQNIWIPAFGKYFHILRCHDADYYAQSMAYVQNGSIIVQTINPRNTVARLQLVSYYPLTFRKVLGQCPCDDHHSCCHDWCHHHCHHHCHNWCWDPCHHQHCHHHHCHHHHHQCLCVRTGAVCDNWSNEVWIQDPLQSISFYISILR